MWEYSVVTAQFVEHLYPRKGSQWTAVLREPTDSTVLAMVKDWGNDPFNCLVGWGDILSHYGSHRWELVSVVPAFTAPAGDSADAEDASQGSEYRLFFKRPG